MGVNLKAFSIAWEGKIALLSLKLALAKLAFCHIFITPGNIHVEVFGELT